MTSDLEQTRLLRQARVDEKRTVKELNRVDKRIAWVRTTLELPQRTVCMETGTPCSTYNGWEAGLRAEMHEDYAILAKYFNQKWREKFTYPYPRYEGQEVSQITVNWLMFGYDDLQESIDRVIEEYSLVKKDLEQQYLDREAERMNQLSMFSEGA